MAEGVFASDRHGRLRANVMSLVGFGLRVSLVFSPRPTCIAVRRVFAKSAVQRAVDQLAMAPADVWAFIDERYGSHPDELLDVYVPGEAVRNGTTLPLLVWTHGGAFVGGSKDELGGYLRMLCDRGFVVAALRYSLAPEEKYPTAVRQVAQALGYLCANAGRFHADEQRIVLVGDSAGSQISAQFAATIVNPAYAAQLGVTPTVAPEQIKGAGLFCGVYDLATLDTSGPFAGMLHAVGWALSGTRHYREDDFFLDTMSVPNHINRQFPATFIAAGNADPLLPQSQAFAEALVAQDVDVETLFYPQDYTPALGHEFQFELATPEGRDATDRLVTFCLRVTGNAVTE